MAKGKIGIPFREGKPISCIVCGGELHRKSEYYCSKNCEGNYPHKQSDKDKPPFLSKWKIRKIKEARDPLMQIRRKTRRKTNDLVKVGKLKKRPCLVCENKDVIPHHEDYSNPFKVLWLCEEHHKDYHEEKIALFNGKLKWDPIRLTQMKSKVNFPTKKYRQIEHSFSKKVARNTQ